MAESASVPLQLQSVALLRGGFKRFVRAREGEGEEKKGMVLRVVDEDEVSPLCTTL